MPRFCRRTEIMSNPSKPQVVSVRSIKKEQADDIFLCQVIYSSTRSGRLGRCGRPSSWSGLNIYMPDTTASQACSVG